LLRAAGDTADRRRDRGIGKIELGLAHACARHLHGRALLLVGGRRLVRFLLADRAPVGEAFQALEVLARELLFRELLGKGAARLREFDLERCALDLEKHGAGLHAVALGVELLFQNSGDARAQLHLARALGAADRLEHHRHLARRDLDHRHGQRRRRRLGVVLLLPGIALAAGGEREANAGDQEARHGL
jgi:hypothetical protein